jgi:hypothetical protein
MSKPLLVALFVLAGCRSLTDRSRTPPAAPAEDSSLSSVPPVPERSEYRTLLSTLGRVIDEVETREILWTGAMSSTWDVTRHPQSGVVLSRIARVGVVVRDGEHCWYREAHLSSEWAGGEWLAPKLAGFSTDVYRLPAAEGKPAARQTREVPRDRSKDPPGIEVANDTTTEILTEVGIACAAIP